jgi:hypothetical protein
MSIGIATNKRLIDLFNMLKDGNLVLTPSFQRKLVWNNTHKSRFIDTILSNKPFPEIYLADGDIDLETQRGTTLVVDGQQRLSTIFQYITSDPQFTVKNIKTFQELTDEEKTNFFNYVVVVRDLGRLPNSEIIDIFKRINSVRYALNAIEISNALYEGEFISTGKDILNESEFFQGIEIFSESELSRMRDLEFVLLVMATVEEGAYFTGGKEIETYVKRFDEEYPQKSNMVADFIAVLKLISEANLHSDSLWLRRANFFILVVELIRLLKQQKLPSTDRLRTVLVNLEEKLVANRDESPTSNQYAEFYYYTHQNVGSRSGRQRRASLLQLALREGASSRLG